MALGPGTELRSPKDAGDDKWFAALVRLFWPRVCHFIGAQLKAAVAKVSELTGQPIPSTFSGEVDKFVARLSQHPVTLPLAVSWINSVIADVWQLVRPVFSDTVREVVLPMVKSKLPSGVLGDVQIEPCTLGNTPPRICKLVSTPRTKTTSTGGRKRSLDLRVSLEWISDLDIYIKTPGHALNFGLKGVAFSLELHSVLTDLLTRPPFVGGVNIWMLRPPEVKLDFTGALDFLDYFQSTFKSKIKQAVGDVMILPMRIGIRLDDGVDVFQVKHPWPRGLLKIRVLRASGIRGEDFQLSTIVTGKRSADPFVSIALGILEERTKTVKGVMTDVSWEDETFYFLIDEPLDQHLSFVLFDEDIASGSDVLAKNEQVDVLSLLGLAQTGTVDVATASCSLENEITRSHDLLLPEGYAVKGNSSLPDTQLYLEVGWRPLKLNTYDAKSIARGKDQISERVKAVLFVGIRHCTQLSSTSADNLYWVQVTCLPASPEPGKAKEPSSKLQKSTKPKQQDKAKSSKETFAEFGDKKEAMINKIVLLVKHNTPFSVIADTLGITPKQVEAVIGQANLQSFTEDVNVTFEEGFHFLLENLNINVELEVFQKTKKGRDESVGKFSYQVGTLLASKMLEANVSNTPLVGKHPGPRISAQFQLRTVFTGNKYPLGDPKKQQPEPDYKDTTTRAAAAMVYVPGRQPQRRVEYVDRLGRKKVQLDGIWAEDDEITGNPFANEGGNA